MKCSACPHLMHEKGAYKCQRTGVQIGRERLDTDRKCLHADPRKKEDRVPLPVICTVTNNPERVEQEESRTKAPEAVIEATVTYITAMKREAEAADAVVQVAHRVYGIGPDTAEIARVVRGITERRLAALREAS